MFTNNIPYYNIRILSVCSTYSELFTSSVKYIFGSVHDWLCSVTRVYILFDHLWREWYMKVQFMAAINAGVTWRRVSIMGESCSPILWGWLEVGCSEGAQGTEHSNCNDIHWLLHWNIYTFSFLIWSLTGNTWMTLFFLSFTIL